MNLQVQLEISRVNPFYFPEDFSEYPGQNSRQNKADQEDAQPHVGAVTHGGINTDGTDHAARSHAGSGRDILHMKNAGGVRTSDYRSQGRGLGNPGAAGAWELVRVLHLCT